jgi:hypothetical protein
MPEPSKTQQEQIFWGTQSAIWAMILRMEDVGQLRNDEWIQWCNKEAYATADDNWNEALDEARQSGEIDSVLTRYARKILDWCEKHRRGPAP